LVRLSNRWEQYAPRTNSQTYQGQEPNSVITTQYTNKAAFKGGFFIGTSSMIKRTFLALAFLAGLLSPVFAAGTISLSLMQQFGTDNKPLNGGKLYFYAAGTTTPQNAYQDSGLTIPWPNPYTLDSTGRVPQLFFADGQIKVRLTNAAGVVQLAADNLLVVGPSGGGGGGGSVDPTTVLATGDVKSRYGTGVLTGWVRMNGRTVGSATSGATERANADAQALFEYLWGADGNLVVSTGRGASANADWVANKTIALPDARGRVLTSLDDMGNTASGRITTSYTGGGSPITLGNSGGFQSTQLSTSHLPPYTPSGSISSVFVGAQQFFGGTTNPSVQQGAASFVASVAVNSVLIIPDNWGISSTFTGSAQGGTSTAFTNLPPIIFITNYLKL
jgi:hypothetical protein